MNQRVNLFLVEFRKENDWLDAAGLLQSLLLGVIVLMVMSALQYWQGQRLNAQIEQSQLLRDQQIAASNAMVDRLGIPELDPQLLAELSELEDNLRGKQVLLGFLSGNGIDGSFGNTVGFSEYLADLARYHVAGLRITGINLRNGGTNVEISGEVAGAENLPLFLQNLRQGLSYRGKDFETLQMENAEESTENNNILMFSVGTFAGGETEDE